jgi:MFS family permease
MSNFLGRHVYYGWWIVAVSVLLTALSSGSAFYAFGLFIVPFEDDFGWGRGQVSGAISLHFLIVGLTGPFAGRFIDRNGAKVLILVGLAIAGTSYLALTMVSTLWALYALWAVLAVGTALFGIVPVGVLVARWFDRRRGAATGIAMVGVGLGGLVLSPITGSVVDSFGWERAAMFLGLLLLTLPAPFVLLLIRNAPADLGLLPDGARSPEDGTAGSASHPIQPIWRAADAIRTPAFWFVGGAFFLASMATVGVLQHQASFMRDYALAPSIAALGVGLTSGVGAAGKLAFGVLADRFPVRYAALVSFGCQTTGLLLLLTTQQTWALWAYVVLFGIGMGATVVLVPLLVAEVFGTGSFGTLFGAVNAVQGLGLAIGPLAAGIIFDTFGSYNIAFEASLVLYLGASVLVFAARRPGQVPTTVEPDSSGIGADPVPLCSP